MATTMTPDEIKALKGRGWLHNKGTDSFSARVITVNGKVTADQLQAVAEAAHKFGSGDVTFTSRQTIEVLGVPAQKTGDFEAAATDSAFAVVKKTFPMFILVFAAMAALNTMGFFSADGVKMLGKAGKYLFAGALAGVGFKIKFSEVFSKGVKPITLGGITWACVAMSSFLFAVLFKGYID